MIQRIQTVFLALASACAFGLFGLPLAETAAAVQSSEFLADAQFTIQDHPGLIGLFVVAGLLALVAVFLFNNRPLQARLSRFGLIANILGVVLAVILFMQDTANSGEYTLQDGYGVALPILFIVFSVLAIRFITKDEKLVKSMDRLR